MGNDIEQQTSKPDLIADIALHQYDLSVEEREHLRRREGNQLN